MENDERHPAASEQACEAADLIIQGGIILTLAQESSPPQHATICVKDGRISAILTDGAPLKGRGREARTLDASGALVLPGLVNAHTHAAMTIFRGYADDLPLNTWLFEKIFPAEAEHLSPETVYWGTLLGCAEMIASGTTCFLDGYFFEDAALRAVADSGMRALVCQGVIDFPAPGVPDPKRNLETARRFIEAWNGVSDRVTPGLFCHSPVTCSARTITGAYEMSAAFGIPFPLHLSETQEETLQVLERFGKRPVQYLDALGVLDERTVAAHAIHLDREEIALLGERGAKVVHVPQGNMKLSSGTAPVREMIRRGIRVGLGTDGCASNNNLDLLEEMDTAAKLSKVAQMDPEALDASTVLKMATVWGAEALGLGDEVGTIEVGKQADLITIDLQAPHLTPLYDACSALVYSAGGGDVRDVVVAGRILMEKRCFKDLEIQEILAQVRRIGETVALGKPRNPC